MEREIDLKYNYYSSQLVYRLHLVLDCNRNDSRKIRDWHETLRDFFNVSWPAIPEKDRPELLDQLDKAERLILTKVAESEQLINYTKAYNIMEDLFRRLHESNYKKGLYAPVEDAKITGYAGRPDIFQSDQV